MAEILEIVHNLKYNVDSSDLKEATSALNEQITKIADLTGKVQRLEAQLKQTAKGDSAARDRINEQIKETVILLDQENEELGRQYVNNGKVQQIVAKQIGLINELNNRYQTLTKLKNAAFDPKDIARYNVELQKTQRQLLQVSNTGLKTSQSFNAIGFTFGNIVRDAPSFAFGLQAGAIAISNNIGPAFDALTQRVKSLRAEGKPITGVFREIGSALFGLTGILNIAVLAFTLFGDKIVDAITGTNELTKEQEKYEKSLTDIEKQTRRTAGEELARIAILRAIAENEERGNDIRLKAAATLQAIAPITFGILTKEAILAGNVADAYERAAEAILKKAKVQAAEGIIQASFTRTLELELQKINQGQRVTSAQTLLKNQQTNNTSPRLSQFFPGGSGAMANTTQLQSVNRELGKQNEIISQISDEEKRRNQLLKIIADDITIDDDIFDTKKKRGGGRTRKSREEKIKQIDKEAKDTYIGTLRLIDQQLEQNKILSEDLKFLNEQEIDLNTQFQNQQISLEDRDRLLEEIGLKKQLVVRKLNFDALNQKVQLADQFGNTLDKAKFTQELQGAFQELQDVTIQLTVKYAIRGSTDLAPDQLKEDIDKLANGPDEQFKDQDALIARQNRRERFQAIINEYQNLASSIAAALNAIYEAQIKAYDREINIRERRVEDARRIAEKGNTDILREEERALRESLRQREEAARRQAAINAALALSESIVAIAKAAAQGGGYGAIATVAAVIAALGAGYAFVKSQENTPAFKDGVVDLKGAGTGTSDSIHARLSRGESVIPADVTQKNKPLIEALVNRQSLLPHLPVIMRNESKEMKGLGKELALLREDVQNIGFRAENRLDGNGVTQLIESQQRRQQRARR